MDPNANNGVRGVQRILGTEDDRRHSPGRSDANNKAVFLITIASGDMDTVKGVRGGALPTQIFRRGESGRGEHGDEATRSRR